jgi:hypothetical protein
MREGREAVRAGAKRQLKLTTEAVRHRGFSGSKSLCLRVLVVKIMARCARA